MNVDSSNEKVALAAFFSLLIIGFLVSIQYSQIGMRYDVQRVVFIITLLFVAMLAERHQTYLSTKVVFFVGIVFFLGSVSSLSSASWIATVEVAQICLLVLGILVLSLMITNKNLEYYSRFALLYFVILSFAALVNFIEHLLIQQNLDGLTFGFVNRRFFNQIQPIAIALAFICLLDRHDRRRMIFLVGFLSCQLYLAIMSGGRGILMSMLLGFFVVFCLSARYRRTLAFVILLSITLSFVLTLLTELNGGFVDAERFVNFSSSGRLDLWMMAFETFLQSPWLGSGPGTFGTWNPNVSGHPHNLFLKYLSEWGVGGVVILVFCFAKMVHSIRRRRTRELSVLQIGVIYGIVSLTTYSMFSGVFVMPVSMAAGLVFIPIFLFAFREQPNKRIAPQATRSQVFSLRCIIAACTLILLSGVAVHFLFSEPSLPEGGYYFPSFWADSKQVT